MEVQDIATSNLSIEEIISDPQKRSKLVRILLQALNSMGYQQTARQLQKQANMAYYSPAVLSIKLCLEQFEYENAAKLIPSLEQISTNQKSELMSLLLELQFYFYLEQEDIEKALGIASREGVFSEKVKQELCEKLVFQHEQITLQKREAIHVSIVERCSANQIDPNSIEKFIQNYLMCQNDRKNFFNNMNDIMRNGENSMIKNLPPMRIVSISEHKITNDVTLIKINRKGNKAAVLSQDHSKGMEIGLYGISRDDQLKSIIAKDLDYENIQCMSWSYDEEKEILAMCSYRSVYLYDMGLKEIAKIKTSTLHKQEHRNLACEWHSVSNLLYVGGTYNSMRVYTTSGELCMTVEPMIKIRAFVFNNYGGGVLAISATDSNAIKYNLITEKEELSFKAKYPFMSISTQNQHIAEAFLVTNQEFIYVLTVHDFNVLHKIQSPENIQQLTIQTYFYQQEWIVCLCNNFTAKYWNMNCLSSNNYSNTNKTYSWEGNGAVDIHKDMMVSGRKEVVVWKSGHYENGLEWKEKKENSDNSLNSDEDEDDEESLPSDQSELEIEYFESQNYDQSIE